MGGFGFQKMMGFGRKLCGSTMTRQLQVTWALQAHWNLCREVIGVGIFPTGLSDMYKVVTLAGK
jgi:hypothetical protein